ncbi:hypothetical protein NMY22_g16092 [Coprinellus aureogranulatus]|nr:hypothetical protein NMY22_g16092 [Coprinellus aureogranulatus]
MASAFFGLGLRTLPGSLSGISYSEIFPESRVLKLLTGRGANLKFPAPGSTTGSRTFFTSTKRSVRYPAPPPPPPSQSTRWRPFLFLNRIPENVVLYGIMGLNAFVFGMWFMAQQKYKLERDAKPLVWMYQNFTDSWANLQSGRVWTLLTSCFSHKDWGHIFFNGFTFFFMSPMVLRLLGSRSFIFLYLGAGLVGCVSSLFYNRYIDKRDIPSHGASGAIYGVVTFLACVAPTLTFQLYGIIPIPAWLAVVGLFSYDAYSTYTDNRGGTDTVGHIGGMLSGVAYFIFMRRSGRLIKI